MTVVRIAAVAVVGTAAVTSVRFAGVVVQSYLALFGIPVLQH